MTELDLNPGYVIIEPVYLAIKFISNQPKIWIDLDTRSRCFAML